MAPQKNECCLTHPHPRRGCRTYFSPAFVEFTKYCHPSSSCSGNPAKASTSASIAASSFFDIASFQMSRRHYGKGSGGLTDLTPVARHLGENGL